MKYKFIKLYQMLLSREIRTIKKYFIKLILLVALIRV